jgi:deazaflavin-dependent oxidoreductase (nitroreductase family)
MEQTETYYQNMTPLKRLRILRNLDGVKKEKFVYLTTRGRKSGRDHEVELWFAISEGRVYLSHEGKHTDWMKNLIKDGNVKMKIGSEIFNGIARITEGDSHERTKGMRALYSKYYGPASKETLDDWFELSSLIEIEPI